MIRIISYVVVCLGLLAIASSVFFDWSEFTKVLVTTPGLVALIGALYELRRDDLAHERQLILRRREEIFEAGFASHMAEVAFDKHVEFCEEYIEAVNKTNDLLCKEGPSRETSIAADDLSKIRQKYILWITSDIKEPLVKFEAALGKVGVMSMQLEGMRHGDERSKLQKAIHDVWQDLIGVKKYGADRKKKEISHSDIIDWLQSYNRNLWMTA